jgi:hypothetical protein
MNNATTAKCRWSLGIPALFSLLLVASSGTAANRMESLKGPQVTVRVVKIHDSPMVWSGVIRSIQWMDVMVAKSSLKTFGRGQQLHLGVALVKGHLLFDSEVPEFSSKKVRVDGILSVRIGPGCLLPNQSLGFAVDPTCIRSAK